ncbi:hypothetical protein [Lactobacillus sp.]|uniref:hypothetical protein n=1 Tax=Lactobacillus sp. TaxID=1591 RepID=UPI0019BC4D9E|nr:hypothetical protein [Lactobacillus sp.]MBD5429237.1 hypothetical protein [Lactobacillus sp.]
MIYDSSTALNAGGNYGWSISTPGKTKVFGDSGHKNGSQGTVLPEQKKGQISYVPATATNSFNVTFVHGYKTVPSGYQSHRFASPTSSPNKLTKYAVKSLHSIGDHYDENVKDKNGNTRYGNSGRADYFGFAFDSGSNIPYPVSINKMISTHDKNFKEYTSSKKPLTVKDSQPIFFDIHTQLKEPTSAFTNVKNKDDAKTYYGLPLTSAVNDPNDPYIGKVSELKKSKKSKQILVLRDYIDPRFEIVSAKIYYSKWGDTYLNQKNSTTKDASKFFTVYSNKKVTNDGNYKGYTAVDAVMTTKAMKFDSDAWMKDYHLIIKVKLKDGLQPDYGTRASGWSLFYNKAYLNYQSESSGGYVKVTYNHKEEEKTTTDKDDHNPDLKSLKEVYSADLADPTKLGKELSAGSNDTNAKLTGASVYPDQYLYYRLRFTIQSMGTYEDKKTNGKTKLDEDTEDVPESGYKAAKKGDPLIKDEFTDLTITNNLSDRFRNKSTTDDTRDVDRVKVVLDDKSDLTDTAKNHDFTIKNGKLQVKLDKDSDAKLLKTLSESTKAHYLYVQYRVRIRPNDVKNHSFEQDLKLEPSTSENQYTDPYKVENQASIDGHFIDSTRTVKTTDKFFEDDYNRAYSKWQEETKGDELGHKSTTVSSSSGSESQESDYHHSVSVVTDWDQKTKTLSEESSLLANATTNKTINWIKVVDIGPTTKIPISWANTGDVINGETKVWKVQSDLPSIREEGKKLTKLNLTDKVQTNEKLDPKLEWTANSNDDDDLKMALTPVRKSLEMVRM